MNKGILGIDPGLTGGLALRSGDGILVEPMPVHKKELNLAELTQWLVAHKESIELAYVEQIHAFQKASRSSMLSFGRILGAIEGVLTALAIPYQLVRPGIWCKELHCGLDGKPKDKSRVVVARLFPQVDLRATPKSKKIHEGMMDALLIAEYGYRKRLS